MNKFSKGTKPYYHHGARLKTLGLLSTYHRVEDGSLQDGVNQVKRRTLPRYEYDIIITILRSCSLLSCRVMSSSYTPDEFDPALPICRGFRADLLKCSNVSCSHGPQCVNFSSHYDRHDVLACGWPSDIVDTGAAVNVGACGWPSEIVDMGAAVPVGAWG